MCIVEAMKVMNEITADIMGEITAIFSRNEQVVEYKKGLFKAKEGDEMSVLTIEEIAYHSSSPSHVVNRPGGRIRSGQAHRGEEKRHGK